MSVHSVSCLPDRSRRRRRLSLPVLLRLWQVLFYMSPVNRLVGALMTVLSLFPGVNAVSLLEISTWKRNKHGS